MLGLVPSAPTTSELNAFSKLHSTWREVAGSRSRDKPQVCSVHANPLLSLCSSLTSQVWADTSKMWAQCWDVATNNLVAQSLTKAWHVLPPSSLAVQDQSWASSLLCQQASSCGLWHAGEHSLTKTWFFTHTRTEETQPILQIFQPISPPTSHTQVPWSLSSEAEWLEKFYEAWQNCLQKEREKMQEST